MGNILTAIGLIYILSIAATIGFFVCIVLITVNTFKIKKKLDDISSLLDNNRQYEQTSEENITYQGVTEYKSLFGSKRE